MRILVAPESFYPSMKAQAVAQAMMRGLLLVSSHFEVSTYPLASGGIGTTDLAVRIAHGRIYHETISVPNRRPRDVKWGLLPDGTAIFNASDVLGPPDGPSVLPDCYLNSAPLGEMLHCLLRRKPSRIVVAAGDVLTADIGMGVLESFGVTMRGALGESLRPGTRSLLGVSSMDGSSFSPPAVPLLALTDCLFPWSQRIQQEDFRLDLIHGGLAAAASRFVDLLSEQIQLPLGDVAGTGAGGGLGVALRFLGAQFMSGADYLGALGDLRDKIWQSDWVFTGSSELSSLSHQRAVGKVAGLARDAGVPAVALTLTLGRGHSELYDAGLVGVYPVLDRPRNERDSHRALAALMEKAAYRVGYWMQALSDA